MTLYHVTTSKKISRYISTGGILPPVRGWINVTSARNWMERTGRDILLKIEVNESYPLPDHKPFGHAHWANQIVRNWEILEADK